MSNPTPSGKEDKKTFGAKDSNFVLGKRGVVVVEALPDHLEPALDACLAVLAQPDPIRPTNHSVVEAVRLNPVLNSAPVPDHLELVSLALVAQPDPIRPANHSVEEAVMLNPVLNSAPVPAT